VSWIFVPKIENWFSSYSQKCRGCFFWDTVYILLSISFLRVSMTQNEAVWPEVPTSHLSDELAVVIQVRRSEVVQRLVHQHRQFEVSSQFHRQPMKLSEHWSDLVTSTSSSDEPSLSRSVPTAAVGPNCQRCHTAVCYSSLVVMTRTTELGSSWHRLTTNVQSFVADAADSRPNDRLQWRGQTSLNHCQWPLPSYVLSRQSW